MTSVPQERKLVTAIPGPKSQELLDRKAKVVAAGVALALECAGKGFEDEAAAIAVARTLDFHALDDARLGSPEVGEGASRIAVMPGLCVRTAP